MELFSMWWGAPRSLPGAPDTWAGSVPLSQSWAPTFLPFLIFPVPGLRQSSFPGGSTGTRLCVGEGGGDARENAHGSRPPKNTPHTPNKTHILLPATAGDSWPATPLGRGAGHTLACTPALGALATPGHAGILLRLEINVTGNGGLCRQRPLLETCTSPRLPLKTVAPVLPITQQGGCGLVREASIRMLCVAP